MTTTSQQDSQNLDHLNDQTGAPENPVPEKKATKRRTTKTAAERKEQDQAPEAADPTPEKPKTRTRSSHSSSPRTAAPSAASKTAARTVEPESAAEVPAPEPPGAPPAPEPPPAAPAKQAVPEKEIIEPQRYERRPPRTESPSSSHSGDGGDGHRPGQQSYGGYNRHGGSSYHQNNRYNNNQNQSYQQRHYNNSGQGGAQPDNAQQGGGEKGHHFDHHGGQQQQPMQHHQYVEVSKGFTIQELNKKSVAELLAIIAEMNIEPGPAKRVNPLIVRIMHEQIKRAGGYAAEGVLDILEDGYGFLRTATYSMNEKDVYVSPSQIRRFDLRTGDIIIGQTRAPKEGEKFAALLRIEAINFEEPERIKYRKTFDALVPFYPNKKFTLESKSQTDLSTRIMDLLSPVGLGQRGLIVAPPKAGKTTLLKFIANSIIENHPEVELMILLIDERPEEVTDMQRSVDAEVISSTFDEPLEHHIKVSELTLEKAKRMIENDKNVVILLDSITRLARAYNLQMPSSGQTLTGGVNPAALYKPKKFFGAARNIEGGGSLTILATALVETGSKLDDIIFEEFKGTGNMELVLDRKLFDKRLFPCIDIKRSGTRKEELLLAKDVLNKVWVLRKVLDPLSPAEAMQLLVDRMSKTKSNASFLEAMQYSN